MAKWSYYYREGYYDGIFSRKSAYYKIQKNSQSNATEYDKGYKRGEDKRIALEKSGDWTPTLQRKVKRSRKGNKKRNGRRNGRRYRRRSRRS